MWDITIWYLALFIIGIISIPIGQYLFKNLDDFAYPFYRAIGLAIISYLVWILGILRILPFNIFSIILSFCILIGISSFFLLKTKPSFNKPFIQKAITYEIIFLVIFSALIIYKLYRSEISDIEKFMDFAFLNTLLKTSYFPSVDPWLSGHSMNYYYFGHLVTAVLTKVTGIKSIISYNLMQATNYTLFIVSIFSIGYNLTKKYLWAFVTAFIAAGMSNISYLIFLYKKIDTYWWAGTRIIPGTINEFPLYSFLLGDLHAHYLDLPFVLLVIISFYTFFINKDSDNLFNIFIGFILGILFITNSWDYLIYALIFAALTVYKNIIVKKNYGQLIKDGLIIGVTSLVVLLPFYLTFKPASEGFQFVTAPKSLLTDFLTLYLLQVFVISFYILYRFIKTKSKYKITIITISFFLAFLIYGFSQVSALILFLIPLWLMVTINDIRKDTHLTNKQFINILILAVFVIIIFCEYFFLKDIYGIDFQRANTVFKFHYQVWVLFAIISGYIFYYFTTVKDNIKYVFYLFGITFLLISSAYLPKSVYDSANSFSKQMGLDGSGYIASKYSFDYQAILWINKNILGEKIIVETVGESYTDGSRISVFTGNATPLGWFGHEWGWRKNVDDLNIIKKDIDTLYKTNEIDTANIIINKYKINFIYYGELEKIKYGEIQGWAIPHMLKKVYRNEQVSIYKVK
ncbi:MAG: DUF2298 domain-containing protein [bacterium]